MEYKTKGSTQHHFFQKSGAGFTLVELLVAIAIISILAGIVLVSLNSGRNTAKDTRIKAAMTQVRLLGQILYKDDLNYSTTFVTPEGTAGCTVQSAADVDLLAIGREIRSLNGVTNCGPVNNGELRVYNTGSSAYGATAKLNDGTFWCVDSTGVEKGGYTTRAAALTSTTDYTCN